MPQSTRLRVAVVSQQRTYLKSKRTGERRWSIYVLAKFDSGLCPAGRPGSRLVEIYTNHGGVRRCFILRASGCLVGC